MKLQILKTGLVFLALNLILVFTTNAQVGIGTTDPKSSLQVEGNPGDTTTPDGVQVPSLTITQLEGKIIGGAYGADQDGAIVYITDASIGSTISETADIQNKGFYYYFHNGVSGIWRVIGEQKIDLTNPDRVPRWDGTNLIEGSIIDAGGNIGIGTLTPDAQLDVEGTFQFKNGTEGESKLLTSDENGNASWRDFSAENLFGQGNLSVSNFDCVNISGSLDIGAFPISIEVTGNYAYVVDEGSDDLKVIDITNPATTIVSGSLVLGSQPKSISLAENYAYVVDSGSDDLKVIDISNPSAPSIAGNLGIGTSPVSVTVTGNYAYVVDQDSDDLKVIDISNPASPSLSGSLGLGSIPQSISVEGNYAYVVDSGSNDLKVIDISDKTAPTLSGSLLLANSPVSIEVIGSYVYVVDRSSNDLKIIDISNPAAPSLTGSLSLDVGPRDLKVVGNYAFVIDDVISDLKVIEISDPALPSLVGSLDLGAGNQPRSITVSNGYAYIVDIISDDLKIINLSCQMTYNPFSNNVELMTAQPYIWTLNGNSINNLNMGNVGIGTENPSSKLDVAGSISGSTLDTGQGANELYAMNQNMRTFDNVTFNSINTNSINTNFLSTSSISTSSINTGPGSTEVHLMDQNVRTNDAVTFSAINTGPGLTEVHRMNQNVRTNDNVSFATVNTGFGATEVRLMNQNVRTTDNVTFNRIRAGSGITSTEGTLHIKAESGVFPAILLEGGSEDISIPDGEALQIGHWNGSSFTERLRMSGNGNFGIGRTASSNRLEVNGNASKSSSGNWQANSDARLKMNITSLSSEQMLENLLKLKGITYEWNDEKTGNDRPKGIQYGFTAQNIQEVFPTLVNEDSLGFLQTAYGTYDAMTIEAIRALNDKIKALEKENEELKAKVDKIDQLEAMLTEIKTQLTVTNKEDSFNVEAQD